MTLVDTHCHLHFHDFDPDREAVVARARAAGVEYFVNVGTDPGTNSEARAVAQRVKNMHYTVGLHPHSAHQAREETFAMLERQITSGTPVAIGEIGLDYFKSEGKPDVQKDVFRRMVEMAKKHSLPVIIHSRDAFDDTHSILKELSPVRGVMHCFSYDTAAMKKMTELGFYISFSCNITYKNAVTLLEAAKETPLERIVFETDSPYLSPQTKRGKRNEPANVAELVVFLAEARGIGADELAEKSTANAKQLFGFRS